MKTKISVIIPAHNSAGTISQALNSILKTTLDNFEVIVINNGSSDDTDSIVHRYQQTDSRVIYAESEKGVSNARNKGIDCANGEWLLFVDADDQLAAGAMDVFNAYTGTSSDLILFNYNVGNQVIKPYDNSLDYIHLFRQMLSNPTKCMTVWNKLFRADVIKEYHLLFNTSLKYSEDSEFLIRYLKTIKTIQVADEATYHYNLSGNSTVRTYNPNSIAEYVRAVKVIQNELAELPQLRSATNNFILMQFNLIMVHNVFSSDNPQSFLAKISKLRNICQNEPFKVPLQSIKISKAQGLRFLPVILAKYHLNFLAGLIYAIRVAQNNRKNH